MSTTYRKFLILALLPFAFLACAQPADEAAPTVSPSTTVDGAPGDWDPADDAGVRGPNQTTTTVAPTTTTTTAPPPPPVPPAVANARRSAESYLSFSGFSRDGLIRQLSSEYGDQYPLDVATAAVDGLTVDWNAEAVESAESYLSFTGFSRQGLIDQLSSEYGDQFTIEQATHAANVMGL